MLDEVKLSAEENLEMQLKTPENKINSNSNQIMF